MRLLCFGEWIEWIPTQFVAIGESGRLWYSMSGHDAGGKRLIEIPTCVDRLDIEFHNLCYYPSGKKGESQCVPRADCQERYYDRTYETDARGYVLFFFLRGIDPRISD